MKFSTFAFVLLSDFVLFSCLPADNQEVNKWESYIKGTEPEFFNLPEYTSSQLKYDRKHQSFHWKFFKMIKKELDRELQESSRICNQHSDSKNSLEFQQKWKKRGQNLLNELVKFDPLGRSSALYGTYFELIRYMSQGITGSVYLKCENDPGFATEKEKFKGELKKIENYLHFISKPVVQNR
ncbi:MAG: hypothetical protein PF689_11260 [Deltaproteobacteria bacterium]|jgi:hypothetical protein|nr:hypothetical protein [Deltaproteobacteria bacterium]